MADIAPAVLAETSEDYRHDLELAVSLSDRIQVDLVDGEFASNLTINLPQVYWPSGVRADIHIMYKTPLEHLPTLIAMSPHLVIFHAESEDIDRDSLVSAAKELDGAGIKAGLALLPDTSTDSIAKCLEMLDHVLIFTGELGHYGGEMRLDCLYKIAEAKHINPSIEAGVDGGINDSNAAQVVAAGADVLNVGGFLQNADDPKSAYAKLENVIKAKQ